MQLVINTNSLFLMPSISKEMANLDRDSLLFCSLEESEIEKKLDLQSFLKFKFCVRNLYPERLWNIEPNQSDNIMCDKQLHSCLKTESTQVHFSFYSASDLWSHVGSFFNKLQYHKTNWGQKKEREATRSWFISKYPEQIVL